MANTSVLFTQVQVFDGSGTAPYPAEVRVTEGTITEVSAPRGRLARDGARVIDGGGNTLMPGLIEPHAHLTFPNAATRADFEKLPPEEHVLVAMHNARTMLDSGYTSCLSAASAKPRLDVVIRNEINAERIPGPRMLANSPEITVTGGLGDINQMHLPYSAESSFSIVVDGADAMRKLCRTLVREGVDLLKLNLSGDLGQKSAASEHTVMTDAEVAACVEVAASRDLRVCCHARSAEAVQMALRHGIPIIYHANFADEAALDGLEAAKERVFVAPALGITHAYCHRAEPWGVTYQQAEARGFVRELECGAAVARELHKRGVRVLPGGDYGFAWTPHGTYARDLELFVKLVGLSPSDTLVAATRLSGEILGADFAVGQVKAGYSADLLLVRGNPVEDITLLQEPENLLMIMQGGRFHKAPPPDLARAQQGAA